MGGIPFLGSCDAVVPVYDRRFDAVFTVKVRRYVRQLLARLSEDSEAGVSAVYFRNDCSGNLLGLDSSHIYLYSNTLQSIAVGYFIAAVIQLHFSFRWQIGITLLLLFIYWIPMTFWVTSHRLEILPNRWTDVS